MKFSIITAAWNSEDTVANAIKSVSDQTYPFVEHIVVEGRSTDATMARISEVSHNRMRLISEDDQGIYDALNKGIKNSTGDIIGFVHSDDYYADSDVLVRIAEAFEDPSVECVYADLHYVAKSDTSRVVRHWSTGRFTPRKLKHGWMPAHPTLFLRSTAYERVGVFDTSYQISADYEFILRYFSSINQKHVYLQEVIYKMRIGGESNRSLKKIRRKMSEDTRALRTNHIGGVWTLCLKNLSKLKQLRL